MWKILKECGCKCIKLYKSFKNKFVSAHQMEVVALGTGSKCLGKNKLNVKGKKPLACLFSGNFVNISPEFGGDENQGPDSI